MRSFVALAASFVLLPLGFSAFGAGCSSSPEEDGGADAATACASEVSAMNDQACGKAGLRCAVDYACGAFRQQAICTCESGKFVCGDPQGQLAPGEEPRCAPTGSTATPCPGAYAGTEGTTCKSTWQYCTWLAPTCAAAPSARLNACLCRPDDTGKLAFECEPDPCDADGGTYQPPADAAADADADAADAPADG